MDQGLLTFFIAVTSIAVVIQAGILVALYVSVKKSSDKALAIAEQVQAKALPALDNAQAILADAGPKIQTITSNLVDVTTTLKSEVERADLTVADLLDRTRLQIIRADEMVSRAMDKVEETTELVQHSVISPVKQVSAIIQGVTAGIGAFMGRRARRNAESGAEQDEELFI
jgi:ElaB/YqjD/DUF883 family membrane-anchored ribosome-binding protein